MGNSRKLTLRITGPLTVRGPSGGTVNLRGDHVRCLFVLLACSEGQSARRAWLSDLLWHPDTDTPQARLGLRQLLHRLKQQLRPLGEQIDLIGADKDMIWLNSNHVWIDLREIESLILLNSEAALERALSLYGGPVFKDEVHLTDRQQAYIARLNESLLAKLVKAAKVLLRAYQKEKLYDSALRVAESLAELAPLSAETQVTALEACINCGSPETALRLYERHADATRQELDAAPMANVRRIVAPFLAVSSQRTEPGQCSHTAGGFESTVDLPAANSASSVLAAPRTVSYMVIRVTPIKPPKGMWSKQSESVAFERLYRLVRSCVLTLDGTVKAESRERIEAEFSSPAGAETTPLRAAYSAKRIQAELATVFLGKDDSFDFQLRFAIATCSDSIPDIVSGEKSQVIRRARARALDLPENLAAGSTTICAETLVAVTPIFDCKEQEDAIGQPAYRLGDRFSQPRHFEIRIEKGLSALVARTAELELLRRKWNEVQPGDLQVGVVSGDLGAGKSRLLHDLEQTVSDQGGSVLHIDCNYIHRNTPYYPLRAFLGSALSLDAQENEDDRRTKLLQFINERSAKSADVSDVVAYVFGRTPENIEDPIASYPINQKCKTQLGQIFRLVCGKSPSLMVVDDAEWIDPRTWDCLSDIGDLLAVNGHMTVYSVGTTDRFVIPPPGANFQLSLGPLSPRQCELMVDMLDRNGRLSPDIRATIRQSSGGLPLYIEELTFAALNARNGGMQPGEKLPQTVLHRVRDLLITEDPAASALHCSALFGIPFSDDLLANVCGIETHRMAQDLEGLVKRGVLAVTHKNGQRLFEFRNPTIRAAFEAGVPAETRARIFGKFAEALVGRTATANTLPSDTIGDTWLKAGQVAKAVPHFLDAARCAQTLGAYSDAEAMVFKALKALAGTGRSRQSGETELELLLERATAVTRRLGIGAQEAREAWSDVYDLSLNCSNPSLKFRTLWGQWSLALGSGDVKRAEFFSDRITREATRLRAQELLLEADHCAWTTCHLKGDVAGAERHVSRGIASYSELEHSDLSEAFGGHDPGVCCLSVGAIISQLRADTERAQDRSRSSIRLAIKRARSSDIAHAVLGAMDLALMNSEPAKVLRYGRWLRELAESERYFDFRNISEMFLAWAQVCLTDDREGLQDLRDAYHKRLQARSIGLPLHAWILFDAELRLGNVERAVKALDEAKGFAEATGEKWWQPELLLSESRLFALEGPPMQDKADASLTQARNLAQRQGAFYFVERANKLAIQLDL